MFEQLVPRPDLYQDKRFQLQTYTWSELDRQMVPKELQLTILAKKNLAFPVRTYPFQLILLHPYRSEPLLELPQCSISAWCCMADVVNIA